jgi:CheY-like chemotaxis protein
MPANVKVVALKQDGTSPAAEGMLARFADVRTIKSPADALLMASRHPDLVLIDIRMEARKARDIVQMLQKRGAAPIIMLVDFEQPPAKLRQQLSHLAKLTAPRQRRTLDFPRISRVLGISQEGLSRILNVSTKTAHRWMNGTRPRPKPELERLTQLITLLLDTLPTEESIRTYLRHANPALDGHTPMNFLVRGEFDRVVADVQAVAEGVYV